MKKLLVSTLIIGCILSILAYCKKDPTTKPINLLTTFPTTPTNMGATINSIYDDYNSTAPPSTGVWLRPFLFSSNRNSSGGNFDIIYKQLSVYSIGSIGTPTLTVTGTDVSDNISSALATINTDSNQLGPYFIGGTNTLLYATNDAGNLNIKYLNIVSTPLPPQAISFLNSTKDDAYPSISKTNSCIYFCSNRGVDFDIYKTFLNTSNSLLQNLADTTSKAIIKETVLSSSGYDDKCPYVVGNTMVFTSNRPGGYGGFDLYYSIYNNGVWSAPINFGSSINTSADEYRPIVMQVNGFTNNFMVFSSNRVGGIGGFDLYYVGINNMINPSAITE